MTEGRGGFKKMTKCDMVGGEVGQKNILGMTYFLNGPYVKILKENSAFFNRQTVIYSKLLFFLQMGNRLLAMVYLITTEACNNSDVKCFAHIYGRLKFICKYHNENNSVIQC